MDVQIKLAIKEQELKDLTNRFRAEMIEKDREVDEFRQLWKETARELRKCHTQESLNGQVIDPELVQKARQLQYNVFNFACQHFGDGPSTAEGVEHFRQYIQKQLQVSIGFFEACMSSPRKRPTLVIAFLWHFLKNDLSGKFRWGGSKVQCGMENLLDILSKPLESDDLVGWPTANCEYETWKANTSALLVDALEFAGGKGHSMSRRFNRDETQDLYTQLAPLTNSRHEVLADQISDIIDEALDLDQLYSVQRAELFWVTNINERQFREDLMEVQQGERRTEDGREVQMIVAPGLMKRGRSTGEDFGISRVLLKITVSCELE